MTINATLIGLGNIAWKYDIGKKIEDCFASSQAGAILRHSGIRLAGGYSPAKEDRELFQKWSGCPAFSCLESMLKQVRPEFVGICSPPQNHFDNFMTALSAGVRIIWLEKPPASTTQELFSMRAAAQKYGVTAGVNYFRRTLPVYQRLKTILQQKQLGECHLLHILYSPGLVRNGCHLLDQLFFLTDADDYKLLWLKKTEDPSNPLFGLRLSTGHIASVCGRNLPYHTNDLQAIFDDGIISIHQGGERTCFERNVPDPIGAGFHRLVNEDSFIKECSNGTAGYMDYSLQDLIDAHKKGEQPASNLATALLTQRLLDEVLYGEKQ